MKKMYCTILALLLLTGTSFSIDEIIRPLDGKSYDSNGNHLADLKLEYDIDGNVSTVFILDVSSGDTLNIRKYGYNSNGDIVLDEMYTNGGNTLSKRESRQYILAENGFVNLRRIVRNYINGVEIIDSGDSLSTYDNDMGSVFEEWEYNTDLQSWEIIVKNILLKDGLGSQYLYYDNGQFDGGEYYKYTTPDSTTYLQKENENSNWEAIGVVENVEYGDKVIPELMHKPHFFTLNSLEGDSILKRHTVIKQDTIISIDSMYNASSQTWYANENNTYITTDSSQVLIKEENDNGILEFDGSQSIFYDAQGKIVGYAFQSETAVSYSWGDYHQRKYTTNDEGFESLGFYDVKETSGEFELNLAIEYSNYKDINLILAISDYSLESFNQVYPNPVKDVLHITTEGSFSIFNLSGQLLITGENKETINVEALETGVYILKTSEDVTKLMKD